MNKFILFVSLTLFTGLSVISSYADALIDFSTQDQKWSTGWEAYFSHKEIDMDFSFEVTDDTAFTPSEKVLRVSRTGDHGFVRLVRTIDGAVVDLTQPYVLSFQIRADKFTGSAEQPFLFTIGGFPRESAKAPEVQKSLWCLVVSPRSTWTIFHGENGKLQQSDTSIPLERGEVYTIKVHLMPKDRLFRVTIESASHSYESPIFSSANQEALSESISFGGWVAGDGSGDFQWSLGGVQIEKDE